MQRIKAARRTALSKAQLFKRNRRNSRSRMILLKILRRKPIPTKQLTANSRNIKIRQMLEPQSKHSGKTSRMKHSGRALLRTKLIKMDGSIKSNTASVYRIGSESANGKENANRYRRSFMSFALYLVAYSCSLPCYPSYPRSSITFHTPITICISSLISFHSF